MSPPRALALIGAGTCACPPGGDSALLRQASEWMLTPKMRKYMGRQDLLAVVAAGRAARAAGLTGEQLAACGLYLAVGFIPFETDDLETLARHSTVDGQFSPTQFAADAIHQVNPLLTFRCLPNMPAFHASYNLGITGSYFVTHPGAAQFYQALDAARRDLIDGRIEHALVGAVVDQTNCLAAYRLHAQLGCPEEPREDLAAFVCLTRQAQGERLWLEELEIAYTPHDPLADAGPGRTTLRLDDGAEQSATAADHPVELPLLLAGWHDQPPQPVGRCIEHRLAARDGFCCTSRWRYAERNGEAAA